jgi:hypothetical protein
MPPGMESEHWQQHNDYYSPALLHGKDRLRLNQRGHGQTYPFLATAALKAPLYVEATGTVTSAHF